MLYAQTAYCTDKKRYFLVQATEQKVSQLLFSASANKIVPSSHHYQILPYPSMLFIRPHTHEIVTSTANWLERGCIQTSASSNLPGEHQ